jgi:hypothetical protein
MVAPRVFRGALATSVVAVTCDVLVYFAVFGGDWDELCSDHPG